MWKNYAWFVSSFGWVGSITIGCLGKELAAFIEYVDQRNWIGEGIGEADIYISHIFIDMWSW